MTTTQIQDIIANNDMDVAIINNQPETVDSYLRDMGHFIPMEDIKIALAALRSDSYYAPLIASGFAQ